MRRWLEQLISYPIHVRGQSMLPTLADGSRVVVNPLSYLFHPPARGDVVLLRAPSSSRLELKRIVGLPGEDVVISGGRIWIQGKLLDEPYARIPPAPPGDEERGVMRLGHRQYLVAGDNRLYSCDSRAYGPVSRDAILGKWLAASC